jgi:hypothetical protein
VTADEGDIAMTGKTANPHWGSTLDDFLETLQRAAALLGRAVEAGVGVNTIYPTRIVPMIKQ